MRVLLMAAVVALVGMHVPDAAAQQGFLTCSSNGYRYNFCSANTQGRVVMLRELSSGNLCRQGRGWGFDNSGIWVDRGCRGEFSYGRSSDGRSRNNDAAIAAGVIGALAVGAAIASSQNAQPAPPPPPPPPVVASPARPPAWAIGSFQGFDPDTGDITTLVVDGAGRVYLRSETGQIVNQGDLRDGMIVWSSGRRSWLAAEGPGVLMGDLTSGKHFYFRRNA